MEGFKLLQKLKLKKSYFYKSNMESTTIHQTDILNRAQLQEALNMFYTTAMSYCPHDETVFRNGAELLMKAINQCAPVSEHNANGVTYDCVYDESSPRFLTPSRASPIQVKPETPRSQVPRQPSAYKGIDIEMHREIIKDIWCQRMQYESRHFLTHEIPIDLISAIYSEHDKSVEYLVLNMALARCKEVNEYLDWIHTHCIDDYKELASTPAKIHEYMELKVSVQNSFRLKNNVYHIDDMRKTPETIADAPPPPKLTRQPTQGKHDFTEQLSPAESRILFTDSICDNA